MIQQHNPNLLFYLNEISKYKVLSIEEERELFVKYQQSKDIRIRNKIIEHNLKFVIARVKKYQDFAPLEDLIQAGNEGLIRAVERFDLTRGFKFISYAGSWIKQSVIKYLLDNSKTVKLPQSQFLDCEKMRKFQEDYRIKYGEEPTLGVIQEEIGATSINKKGFGVYSERIVSEGIEVFSLDEPIRDGQEAKSLLDLIPDNSFPNPSQEFFQESLRQDLAIIIKKKTSKEEGEILESYFGINSKKKKTLKEAGKEKNLTSERVRQIKEKAINKIRGSPTSLRILREYL